MTGTPATRPRCSHSNSDTINACALEYEHELATAAHAKPPSGAPALQ